MDVGVVSDLTYYADRWRRLKIPSFDITNFLGNVSDMISELVSSDAKPALDSPDEKEVKENTEKAKKDYNQSSTIEHYYSPDSTIQENRHNGDTTVFERLGDGKYHIKEFKDKKR